MTGKVGRFVSCVVLCRSSGPELERYVAELSTVLRSAFVDYEMVLVNDGSAPGPCSLDRILAREPYLRTLQLTQAKGDHVAATAGLESAIGDYLCVLDSRNDPPELVSKAVAMSLAGADVVFGIAEEKSGRGVLGRLLERAFLWYAKRYLGVDIASGMGTFRCLSRYAVNSLTRLAQPHRYYRIWGDYVGLTTVRMPYRGRGQRVGRKLGESLDEAIDIAISISPHPLRMISGLAMLFALCNALYVAYVVAVYVLKPDVSPGWTTLSLQISSFSLIMILLLAALSGYIGRLLERVSPNPAYWVRDERTSKQFTGEHRRLNVVEHSSVVDVDVAMR